MKRVLSDFGSSAAGSAIGVGLAALIGMGRKACEGGGLAAGERTELGHEGDEGRGGLLTDALDRDQGFDGLGDRLAPGAQGVDIGFDRLDLRVEAFTGVDVGRARRRGRRADWRRRAGP